MPNSFVKSRLSSACCALLGSSAVLAHAHDDTYQAEPWLMNIGLANYIERDRNTGIEVIVNGSRAIEEDRLTINAELDVITGATPNGATASNVSQTFTQSSGVGKYTTKANELPADDTHMDTRLGLSMTYNDIVRSDFSMDYRSHISMEFDYLSVGAGIAFNKDFNQHNTRLILDLDYEFNNVHPVGNIPVPYESMQPPGQAQPRGEASTTKKVRGFSLALNQVLNTRSLLQFKYSKADASDYLTDPYKIISLIEVPTGNTLDYVYEHRPDNRNIQSIYGAYKLYLTGDVLDFSYRYYWDDWDIRSNTFNIRYRKKLSEKKFIQPHFRYYTQTAAEFYRHSLSADEALPDFASADFRLAEFDAITLGIKYGKQTGENKEHSISAEYYTQYGESHPDDVIGLQKQQDLFPTLHTLVLFYNYAFKW